jgi:hypothetical protein
MTETEHAHKAPPLPFLLKALAVFLVAAGLFKLLSVFFDVAPGPEIFGYTHTQYYYSLVAIVDFSLAVQVFGRAHYAWVWALAFFLLQALVLLTYFTFTSPLSWLGPGASGRVQIVASVALYLFLSRYVASRPIREILSPHSDHAA